MPYGVQKMCAVLNVSRGGYYSWLRRPESRRKEEDQKLLKDIGRIHAESKNNYGTIKTWKALKQEGIRCGKHRVARLRQEHGIESKRRKRFKITTRSKNTKWIAPDLLKQSFFATRINQIWVGDVTAVRTKEGWLYVAILLDLYSRKVIGWSISSRNNKELVLCVLHVALRSRNNPRGVIHHTDRGSPYGSDEYQDLLRSAGCIPSMGRKGNCYDNAVAESFFSTMKNEAIYEEEFELRKEAKIKIFEFIEIYYNRQRIHQGIGYCTPEAMELVAVS